MKRLLEMLQVKTLQEENLAKDGQISVLRSKIKSLEGKNDKLIAEKNQLKDIHVNKYQLL